MTKKNERNAGAKPMYNVPSKKVTRTLPIVVIEKLPDLCKQYLRKTNKNERYDIDNTDVSRSGF